MGGYSTFCKEHIEQGRKDIAKKYEIDGWIPIMRTEMSQEEIDAIKCDYPKCKEIAKYEVFWSKKGHGLKESLKRCREGRTYLFACTHEKKTICHDCCVEECKKWYKLGKKDGKRL